MVVALAVLLGVAVGGGLAVPAGLYLRRRRGGRTLRMRRPVIQRRLLMWVAVAIAAAGVVLTGAGLEGIGALAVILAVILSSQGLLLAILEKERSEAG